MDSLVFLAKLAVENYVKEGKTIEVPEDLQEEFSGSELAELLKRRAGIFVTIERLDKLSARKNGELRGCIGTYLPTRPNIAEEIIRNAVAAASEDYRFGQIQPEELPYLSYTVYILSEPEPVKDIKELDPKKFGIIVKTGPFTYPSGSEEEKRGRALFDHSKQKNVTVDGTVPYKTGLLLPDLEGIETAEQQLAIACQKGGINPEKEKLFIYKFTVEKYQ